MPEMTLTEIRKAHNRDLQSMGGKTPLDEQSLLLRCSTLIGMLEEAREEGRPMYSAPKDGTEIEILFRHMNWQYADDKDKPEWEQWCKAHWIDHNGGGWTRHGIVGKAIAWRELK